MDIRKYILLILLALAGVTQMQAQADRQFIRNGNKLYRQQNYAKAETEYRKALSKNARNTQAMYNLGCALMMQQKDSAAIVQLQNAGRSEQSPRRKAMAYHNMRPATTLPSASACRKSRSKTGARTTRRTKTKKTIRNNRISRRTISRINKIRTSSSNSSPRIR